MGDEAKPEGFEIAKDPCHGHDHGEHTFTSKDDLFVDEVIEANVRRTVADIRSRSAVLAGLESEGKIKIVGAMYSLETGAVTLLD